MTLFGNLADGEDGRLMSQNNHLVGVWMSYFLIEWRRGGVEEVKDPYLANISWNGQSQGGDVLISSDRGAGFPEAGS